MNSQKHALQTLKFDISFYAEDQAIELHKQISKLSSDKIYAIINKVCDEALNDSSVFLQIDKIEIDLGDIPRSEVNHLLPDRLYDQFKLALKQISVQRQLPNNEFDGGREAVISQQIKIDGEQVAVEQPKSQYNAELLFIFLRDGTLPWWATDGMGQQLESIFLTLLKDYPGETIARIYAGNDFLNVIQRIVYQFSEALLKKLVETLNPAHAQPLIQYSTILFKSLESAQLYPDSRNTDSRNKGQWKMLLIFLNPHDSKAGYDGKSMIAFVINQLAEEYNLSAKTLLEHIQRDFLNKRPYRHEYTIQTIIKALLEEEIKKGKEKTAPPGQIKLPDNITGAEATTHNLEEQAPLSIHPELPDNIKGEGTPVRSSQELTQPFIHPELPDNITGEEAQAKNSRAQTVSSSHGGLPDNITGEEAPAQNNREQTLPSSHAGAPDNLTGAEIHAENSRQQTIPSSHSGLPDNIKGEEAQAKNSQEQTKPSSHSGLPDNVKGDGLQVQEGQEQTIPSSHSGLPENITGDEVQAETGLGQTLASGRPELPGDTNGEAVTAKNQGEETFEISALKQKSTGIMKDLEPFIAELSHLKRYYPWLYENIINFTINYAAKWEGNNDFDAFALAFFNQMLMKPLPEKQVFDLLENTFRKFGYKPGKRIDKQLLYTGIQTPDKTEIYYIENAGLVILNPFFLAFFEKLGLMDKKEFSDKYAAARAIHLLQFLADGRENHAEHLLLLNKVLCGRDIHEPVDKEILLSETEKKTSESLLNAVMERWAPLKNSSIDTLRIEFLQRKGKLQHHNGEWVLRIEHNGRSDYLLDTLPWSFKMIKNSWMPEILNVEWI